MATPDDLLRGIGQHSQMSASAPGAVGARRRRIEQTPGRHHGLCAVVRADRIGEAVYRRASGELLLAFPHRVRKRHQVVVLGRCGQRARMADELPAARRGDSAGMADAQVPRVWLLRGSEWTDHCGGVRVNERQRRHRVVRTPGPAAATGSIHDREVIARKPRRSGGHAEPRGDVQPLPSPSGRFARLPTRWPVGTQIGVPPRP